MTTVNMVSRNERPIKQGYEYSETVADGENGETIAIPGLPPGKNIVCTIIAGSNTGKFQYSTSLDSEVEAGTCTWHDWDNGDTTGSYTDVIVANVSSIRGVSVSGEIKIEIKI